MVGWGHNVRIIDILHMNIWRKIFFSLNIWPKKAVNCVEALSGSVDSIKDNQIMVTGIRIGLQMGGGSNSYIEIYKDIHLKHFFPKKTFG